MQVKKPKKSAVLILSHLMRKNGFLEKESILRAKKGYNIYKKYSCDYIITSGWDYIMDCNIPIAISMKKFLLKNYNIKKNQILFDTYARDTVGDAIFTKYNVIEPHLIKKLYIISSNYHIKRAKEIFNFIFSEKILLEFVGVKTLNDNKSCILKKEELSLIAFRNTFFNVNPLNKKNILSTLKEKHPLYKNINYNNI